MNKIVAIAVISLTLVATSIFAHDGSLEKKYHPLVKKFIDTVKTHDPATIAKLIKYPLARPYPIPSIKNEQELIARFKEVFDKQLLKEIINSAIDRDWSAMGWRGIMLNDGTLWLDYNGTLMAINYQSPVEKQLQAKLIKQQRQKLYPSLRRFKSPCLVAETKQFKIRIDDLGNDNYRYAAWEKSKSQSTRPDLIINQGKLIYDGSGGNYYYNFINGNYRYRVYVNILGTAETPPGELEVYKLNTKILHQKIFIFY